MCQCGRRNAAASNKRIGKCWICAGGEKTYERSGVDKSAADGFSNRIDLAVREAGCAAVFFKDRKNCFVFTIAPCKTSLLPGSRANRMACCGGR